MDMDFVKAWLPLEDKHISDVQVVCCESNSKLEWISVTDRYPDDSRPVLVTYKYGNEYEIEIGEYWDLTLDAVKKYPQEYGFGLRHENVIAWAELPKHYVINGDIESGKKEKG